MPSIILYDTHPIVLRGLRELFRDFGTEFVFFEATTDTSLAKHLANNKIDIVIAGINEKTNIDDKIVEKYSMLPWIVMYNDDLYQKALSLFTSGAKGCISKGASYEEMVKCITMVLQSNTYICSYTLQTFGYDFLLDFNNQRHIKNFCSVNLNRKRNGLSRREWEISNLLVTGLRTSQIATLLNLKVSTISTVKRTILLKRNVRNVVELSAFHMD